ncbi:MAG TPA: hypothetical protein VNF68_13265 [Candidatus Baltobacteraceae bacterium]|nr:hypothetical protein [Candidatus Baltobacteraceae bacterium]
MPLKFSGDGCGVVFHAEFAQVELQVSKGQNPGLEQLKVFDNSSQPPRDRSGRLSLDACLVYY